MNKIDYNSLNLIEHFYLDETSPSGLRWKETDSRKVRANKVAGGLILGKWIVRLGGKGLVASRVMWVLLHGEIPLNLVIDHLDGNPSNNKVTNLMAKTHSGNSQNRKKRTDNHTDVTGVSCQKRGGYSYYSAYWQEGGKKIGKCFSCVKLGDIVARQMATEFRLQKVREMNEQGDNYTDRHIS
jgi:hypothetical protein